MRAAFLHDWLTVFAGSERVLEHMLELQPESPVFTMVHAPKEFEGTGIARHPVRTSILQRFPKATERYRMLLPVMPLLVEQFDLSDFDLVVSNVKAVCHGALTAPHQVHVAYVNRPMRYAWDSYHQELRVRGLDRGLKGALARPLYHYLRMWDHQAMQRPDVLAANSRYVQAMVRKYYGRDAEVIYPPVEVEEFSCTEDRDDYFVTVSRLVPYKRADVVVRAFNELGLPLKVIGSGPLEERFRAMARPNVEILGWVSREELRRLVQRARAMVFAAEEEFGIAPVEALAAGAPVIAYARGGVTETVVPFESGILFDEQTPQSLAEAVREVASGNHRFEPERLREQAERFAPARFEREMAGLLERSISGRRR